MIRLLLLLPLLILGCTGPSEPEVDVSAMTWPELETAARDTSVTFAMWTGDPLINAYIQDYVAVELKQRYNLDLNVVSAQGAQIVTALMTEIEAGKKNSAYDMTWINGETFYQLRQIDALHGPFLDQLPNTAFIHLDNPFIGVDFQQPIDGYECPWGNVQMALIYDRSRVVEPPRTRAELKDWVARNPGRFTFDTHFTGMTLLKAWLIDIAGDPQKLAGPFDQAVYDTYAPQLWAYVNELKPYLWREGESFPANVAQLHQMFANGEVDFTMSNNDAEVDNKVIQGLFADTARAYVPDHGTIQNSHYLGVVKSSANKAGAMVAINFMISPQAQLRKMDPAVWGDGTVLAVDELLAPYPEQFRNLPTRKYAPDRAEIQSRALQELAPEYMIRLYEDFRRQVLAE